MTAFSDVPAISSADDADLLLIRDVSGAVERTITREDLLSSYPKSSASQDATFKDVTVNSIEASVADISALKINGGAHHMDSLILASGSFSVGDIAAGAESVLTATVDGITTGHVPLLNISTALPAGLIAQASIRSEDTLSVAFFNATSSTITAATYSYTAVLQRVIVSS